MGSLHKYRTSQKKCATYTFSGGQREIQMVAYKPPYVEAFAGLAPCLVNADRHDPQWTSVQTGTYGRSLIDRGFRISDSVLAVDKIE